MRAVFADTAYWVAIFHPRDPWRTLALEARQTVRSAHLVTTDEVLNELLTTFCASGPETRTAAARFVAKILSHARTRVIPQSRESFLNGLAFYQARRDKEYSLTDCISMNAMRAEGIHGVLTTDHHFAQEGFTVLMRRPH